jgi:hypothetical protein
VLTPRTEFAAIVLGTITPDGRCYAASSSFLRLTNKLTRAQVTNRRFPFFFKTSSVINPGISTFARPSQTPTDIAPAFDSET